MIIVKFYFPVPSMVKITKGGGFLYRRRVSGYRIPRSKVTNGGSVGISLQERFQILMLEDNVRLTSVRRQMQIGKQRRITAPFGRKNGSPGFTSSLALSFKLIYHRANSQ
jgi:hypothetical protein